MCVFCFELVSMETQWCAEANLIQLEVVLLIDIYIYCKYIYIYIC